ncbi:MAG TPA: hypothetical protein VIM28_08330, partial [Solirubrobacterales bacterium]
MAPELAVGLPAVGSVCAAYLRARPRAALLAAAAFGLLGLVAVILTSPGATSNRLGIGLSVSPESRALLIASGAAMALTVVLAPLAVERATLLTWGLAGLAGMAAIAAAGSLEVLILVLLVLAVLQAAAGGSRSFVIRLRGPVLAVVLLSV